VEVAEAVVEGAAKPADKRRVAVSPLNGAELPLGRHKGVPNRVTVTVKQAIERAIQPGECHPQGLAGWLVERAKGSLGDRQIFASVVNKFVPVQLNAHVDGGIKLELGWLGGRQIGTSVSQLQHAPTQVLDLQREKDGSYRIVDPQPVAQGAGQAPAAGVAAAADPHPPSRPARGAGPEQGPPQNFQ